MKLEDLKSAYTTLKTDFDNASRYLTANSLPSTSKFQKLAKQLKALQSIISQNKTISQSQFPPSITPDYIYGTSQSNRNYSFIKVLSYFDDKLEALQSKAKQLYLKNKDEYNSKVALMEQEFRFNLFLKERYKEAFHSEWTPSPRFTVEHKLIDLDSKINYTPKMYLKLDFNASFNIDEKVFFSYKLNDNKKISVYIPSDCGTIDHSEIITLSADKLTSMDKIEFTFYLYKEAIDDNTIQLGKFVLPVYLNLPRNAVYSENVFKTISNEPKALRRKLTICYKLSDEHTKVFTLKEVVKSIDKVYKPFKGELPYYETPDIAKHAPHIQTQMNIRFPKPIDILNTKIERLTEEEEEDYCGFDPIQTDEHGQLSTLSTPVYLPTYTPYVKLPEYGQMPTIRDSYVNEGMIMSINTSEMRRPMPNKAKKGNPMDILNTNPNDLAKITEEDIDKVPDSAIEDDLVNLMREVNGEPVKPVEQVEQPQIPVHNEKSEIKEAPNGYDESKLKKEDIDDLDNKELNNVLSLLKEGKERLKEYILKLENDGTNATSKEKVNELKLKLKAFNQGFKRFDMNVKGGKVSKEEYTKKVEDKVLYFKWLSYYFNKNNMKEKEDLVLLKLKTVFDELAKIQQGKIFEI